MGELCKTKTKRTIYNNHFMKVKEFEYTNDQLAALADIENWVYKPIETHYDCFYCLTGSAGTGKTTILKELIKNLRSPFEHRVCISAPTHKAKKVLEQKTGCEDSETVQSLIGLRPDVDLEHFNPAEPQFAPMALKTINSYKLVIIDEASMVNNDLYQYICDEAIKSKIKVLFTGDTLQLPPINEFKSKTLTEPHNKYNLTEIVRQELTNPLITLLDILRKDIENNTNEYQNFLQVIPENVNEKGEGFVVCDKKQFAEELIKHFRLPEYKEDKNFLRYLSWTNKSIQEVNRFIRERAFGLTELLTKDELLLAYRSLSDEHQNVRLTNSDDYIVENITETTSEHGVRVWVINIKALDINFTSTLEVVIPTKANYNQFLIEHDDKLNTAKLKKGKAWVGYYQYRNSYCLLENLYDGNFLKVKKDIDYGYGVTIHKSQGSTYHTVFINGKDINKNQDETVKKKLWYVGLSRASTKVFINL